MKHETTLDESEFMQAACHKCGAKSRKGIWRGEAVNKDCLCITCYRQWAKKTQTELESILVPQGKHNNREWNSRQSMATAR